MAAKTTLTLDVQIDTDTKAINIVIKDTGIVVVAFPLNAAGALQVASHLQQAAQIAQGNAPQKKSSLILPGHPEFQ